MYKTETILKVANKAWLERNRWEWYENVEPRNSERLLKNCLVLRGFSGRAAESLVFDVLYTQRIDWKPKLIRVIERGIWDF